MIRQVRLKEYKTDASGSVQTPRVFAFGTHDLAASGDYPALGANSMTTAAVSGQSLRIIVDELLVGNYIEEIACRAPVDNDAYDFVPLGTTPDDIAKCSVAKDVLPSSCPGSLEHAVCICQLDTGCGDVPKGGPVGVLDVNQDGAADDTRFIQGAVGIQCGTITVPIDVNNSYWNPSGDQNKPAMGGFEALGPALVISPTGALPTNQTCELVFAPDIVDKQGNQICAPDGGDIDNSCTEGVTSAFKFQTQTLTVDNQSFMSGETGVDRMAPIIIVASAPLSMASLNAITLVQGTGTTPVPGVMVTLPQPQTIRINLPTGGLMANTAYTLRIAATLTDTYGQPIIMPVTYTFTTGS